MDLVDYRPLEFLSLQWMFSLDEILKFYKQKKKDYFEKRKTDFQFLMDLASACLGGKKADSYNVAGEEGFDEMDDETFDMWRDILGEREFYDTYKNYLALEEPEE